MSGSKSHKTYSGKKCQKKSMKAKAQTYCMYSTN